MTPDQARNLLTTDSRSTHGPHTNCHNCKAIRQHAREMMHQIAGMRYEYAVQYQDINGEWDYVESSPWRAAAEDARDEERTLQLTGFTTRIIRRLVTQPEEVQP